MFYLGTIVAAAATATNNRTTATPFVIPPATTVIYLQTTAAAQFEIGASATFQTSAARGAFVGASNLSAGPFGTAGLNPTVVSVYSTAGASVNVYASVR